MPLFGYSLTLLVVFSPFILAADVGSTNSTNDPTLPPFPILIGGFIPKKPPAYIALGLYAISTIVHSIHYITVTPRRPFMLTLIIGMSAMTLGFIFRIIYSDPPFTLAQSLTKFLLMNLFILLSPCAFLATNYMLLSHLVAMFDKELVDRYLLIRNSHVVKIFLWSDFMTLNLQSCGGLSGTRNPTLVNIGNKLVLAGLILQALSFLLFIVVLVVFGWRMSQQFPGIWRPQNARPFKILSRQPIDDWRILFYLMCATSVGILIRSVFRVAESAGGNFIATHEGYFYFFDSLPLWIAMTLYCIVWPTRALFMRREQVVELLNVPTKTYAAVP
ncbi:RTA1 like protein-domain-containing protein [Mycena metata]|uniref:RTA1 like protein-domain-containing protein n=1 Tax=Mycena metata TaxID=1033252 RepID=A0AAD7KH98_9AGAR|nr:RTA1 like protein-domain-containing protein [Mycena metata]